MIPIPNSTTNTTSAVHSRPLRLKILSSIRSSPLTSSSYHVDPTGLEPAIQLPFIVSPRRGLRDESRSAASRSGGASGLGAGLSTFELSNPWTGEDSNLALLPHPVPQVSIVGADDRAGALFR